MAASEDKHRGSGAETLRLCCSASVNEIKHSFIHLATQQLSTMGPVFSNTVEITSSGKEMEVGLVVSPDPDASSPELLGPADPGAAS